MNSTIRRIRPVRVALAATAALLLAGCGGSGDSEGQQASGATSASSSASPSGSDGASAGAHNAQDVSFAQGMIPHHRQAVEMAALAADRASSPQVKALATRIKGAQDPEIRTMSGWLTAWGEDVPAEGGMDHSGHSGMAGMMSGADMTALEKASGAAFDTEFTRMMIEHHEGAVEMAGTEKAKGRYAPALTMADAIITAQKAEIAEMKGFLGKK
ncbi:DUF305 domain-containing protein [Streptomyces acidiscabies]|uniref:DUF305 domain-containing protein n=1 Tax=Streptomyces acidiscabies TaxID=42234 RepID=UPI0038F66B2D